MKEKKLSIVFIAAVFLIFSALLVQCGKLQTNQQADRARHMTAKGVLAKGYNDNGYIIRAQEPSTMILTVLNSEPKILDEYVKTGELLDFELYIVSGDNIKIWKINGREYPWH